MRLPDLDWGGQYQWRQDGEYHMYNPETIHKLQYSTRTNNYKIFKEYSELMNSTSQQLCTLRGLMDLNSPTSRFLSMKSNRSNPS